MKKRAKRNGSDTQAEYDFSQGKRGADNKALLAAELFAFKTEPNGKQLNDSLERGLADVEAGRVRPIEEVKGMIPRWTSKS